MRTRLLRLSEEFLRVAKARLLDNGLRSEANLRRATSDLYYAMFHAVSEALVEPFAAGPNHEAFKEVYSRVYRQVRHEHLEKKCNQVAKGKEFSEQLRRFAKHCTTMKNKRERADYAPLEIFKLSVVENDWEITDTRLKDFWTSPSAERAAFACFVGLKVGERTT